MKIMASGLGINCDYFTILFRAKDGRHFIKNRRLDRAEKAYVEWLSGDDWKEWVKHLARNY